MRTEEYLFGIVQISTLEHRMTLLRKVFPAKPMIERPCGSESDSHVVGLGMSTVARMMQWIVSI